MERIIDRDIAMYQATVEEHERALRTCPPSEERKHRARRNAARYVLQALQAYAHVLTITEVA